MLGCRQIFLDLKGSVNSKRLKNTDLQRPLKFICIKRYKQSISPTIYKQLFCKQVFFWSFHVLTVWIVIFWCKEIGAKAARKMLVKLTTGSLMCRHLLFLSNRSRHVLYFQQRGCRGHLHWPDLQDDVDEASDVRPELDLWKKNPSKMVYKFRRTTLSSR